jgi:ribonuclease-3
MYGDAMEALVGAVYLDRGYKFCKKFILESLIEKHIDIDQVVTNDVNYKSKLIMWAQNRSKTVKFDIIDEKDHKHYKEFTARISIDGQEISIGKASSKKKAEQNASRKAIEIIAN